VAVVILHVTLIAFPQQQQQQQLFSERSPMLRLYAQRLFSFCRPQRLQKHKPQHKVGQLSVRRYSGDKLICSGVEIVKLEPRNS